MSRFQPQDPYPTPDSRVAAMEELVQVAARYAVSGSDLPRRHCMIGQVFSYVSLNARQMAESYRAHSATKGAFVVLDREAKKIHEAASEAFPSNGRAQLLRSSGYCTGRVEE